MTTKVLTTKEKRQADKLAQELAKLNRENQLRVEGFIAGLATKQKKSA